MTDVDNSFESNSKEIYKSNKKKIAEIDQKKANVQDYFRDEKDLRFHTAAVHIAISEFNAEIKEGPGICEIWEHIEISGS